MDTSLQDLQRRLADPSPFVRTILTDVCEKCVAVLKANMYGRDLPNEWTFEVKVSKRSGTATVFHTRLEGDMGREMWEIVFHAHNYGSKRYMIYPVNALALSWVEDGQRYFSKGHEVGGIKPKHFAEKCERVISDYEKTLQGKWDRWMNTGRI